LKPIAPPAAVLPLAAPGAGDDVAFAHALLGCGTPEELKQDPARRLRLTIGLRKRGGRWAVTHEHHSFTDKT
jgi:ketosteroid isomerase-like protein